MGLRVMMIHYFLAHARSQKEMYQILVNLKDPIEFIINVANLIKIFANAAALMR